MSMPKQDDFAYSDEAENVSALLTPLLWIFKLTLSRIWITEHQTKMPDKRLLQTKLHELLAQQEGLG